jgi:predicted HTH transcriptional regulator
VIHWITQLENILSQSYTEQSAYDFKQGFLRLDGTNVFDEDSFEKILATCAGISNIRRGAKGYVLVGVADKITTAQRVEQLFGVKAKTYERFFVVGVEHEAKALGKNLDQLFQMIVERVKASKLSPELRDFVARHIKPVRYYDQTVFVLEIEAQEDPSTYDGKYYVRNGAQLDELKSSTELAALFKRYIQGR